MFLISLKGLIQNQIFMSSIPPQDITAPKMLNLPSPNKFVHIKNSIHWTMAHVSELIAMNEGYTLAEVSENSFENWIKAYR